MVHSELDARSAKTPARDRVMLHLSVPAWLAEELSERARTEFRSVSAQAAFGLKEYLGGDMPTDGKRGSMR